MKFKILNGTPDHSAPSLCFGCASGKVMQGQRESNFRVICMYGAFNPMEITEPITACSFFSKRYDLTLSEMKRIAHVLVTKRGRPVGFVSASEAKSKIDAGEADKVTAESWEVNDD